MCEALKLDMTYIFTTMAFILAYFWTCNESCHKMYVLSIIKYIDLVFSLSKFQQIDVIFSCYFYTLRYNYVVEI